LRTATPGERSHRTLATDTHDFAKRKDDAAVWRSSEKWWQNGRL
jgi:hypothetical protein